MRLVPRIAAAATATAAVAALTIPQLPAVGSDAPTVVPAAPAAAPKAPKFERSNFAFAGSAFGSQVTGGDVPAGSDATAFQQIGCSNLIGLDRTNVVADATVPGLGRVFGVRSRVWSDRTGRTVSSISEHHVARIVLFNSSIGRLQIRGLSTRSEAFSRAGEFGTKITSSVAAIEFKPTDGEAQGFELPAPGQTLEIPGLARISIGKTFRTADENSAVARANALDIRVLPTGTRARVGQTFAEISRGVKRGVFSGFSAGIEATGLADNLKLGRQPLSKMGCIGTEGEPEVKEVAGVNLADQIVAQGVYSGQVGSQNNKVAQGTERGQVAEVSLGGGRVIIRGIIGVVNARRDANGLTLDSKGSTVAEVIVDGETYAFPALGAIEIPGLIKLEDAVTTKVRNGLKVVGLRATLLDGTGAVVDLGVAQLALRPGVGRDQD